MSKKSLQKSRRSRIPEEVQEKTQFLTKGNVAFYLSLILAFTQLTTCYLQVINRDITKVSVEAQWSAKLEEFSTLDETLLRWEKSHGLSRTGKVTESLSDIEKWLDKNNPPADVRSAYLHRQRAYEALKNYSTNYSLFQNRLLALSLKLPARPQLPVGILAPIAVQSIRGLQCKFAGLRAPCEYLIREGRLKFSTARLGPLAFKPSVDIDVPIAIYQSGGNVVFDITILDGRKQEIVVIKHNKWIINRRNLMFGSNKDTLEVLAEDKLPLFQIHFDKMQALLCIGGRFFSATGEYVIALPSKLISRNIVAEDLRYQPGVFHVGRVAMGAVNMQKELETLGTWFNYATSPPELKASILCN